MSKIHLKPHPTKKATFALLGCVRDSAEMVRRQILYMNKLRLPHWCEVVYVDHYSDPALSMEALDVEPRFKFKLVRSNDPRPWCIATLANMAVKNIKTTHFMFMGVDHMISEEFIEWFGQMREKYEPFVDPTKPGVSQMIPHFATGPRIYALLTKKGVLKELEQMGIRRPKQFFSRKLFKAMGEFDVRYDIRGGEDLEIGRRYVNFSQRKENWQYAPLEWLKKKRWKIPELPPVYMLPDKGNKLRPYHLLHDLPPPGMCGNEFIKGILVYDSSAP